MARTCVGQIKTLWRYPVKSMQGEELERSEIGEKGLWRDRAFALWDVQTQRVASAKNPKKWASLLNCHAKLTQTDQPTPTVHLTLPNGTTLTSDQPDLNTHLSDWVGREVQFLTTVPDQPSLDQYWANVDGTPQRDTITQLFMPEGTFFDSCPIHAITTATLTRLQELYPTGAFSTRRFRPNLLIETNSDSTGFVENDWLGYHLTIGDSVTLKVDKTCPRCVVTTVAQGDLPQDLDILRTTIKHNDMIAGIRLSVQQSGTIRQGDPVWLETP